jgi:uncharacterized membrane protein YbaN (DUF454 family)
VIARMLWRALALLLVALAVVGVFVPGLPTVVFLIAAAWAAGRGWPALERWLLEHPRYGADIRAWRERGAVPRRAKWAASVTMAASTAVLFAVATPRPVRFGVPLLMAGVALWLWRRPEQ